MSVMGAAFVQKRSCCRCCFGTKGLDKTGIVVAVVVAAAAVAAVAAVAACRQQEEQRQQARCNAATTGPTRQSKHQEFMVINQ